MNLTPRADAAIGRGVPSFVRIFSALRSFFSAALVGAQSVTDDDMRARVTCDDLALPTKSLARRTSTSTSNASRAPRRPRAAPSEKEQLQLFCLDRDGVINRDVGVPGVTNVDDFELIPGAARAIRALNDARVRVCVVTNQTAVGKGLLDEEYLNSVIHAEMRRKLAEEEGARVDNIYYATKIKAEPCERRKPSPGMILEAQRVHGASASATVMVGDTVTDMQAAARAGNVRRALVCTGYGELMGEKLRHANVTLPTTLRMKADDPTLSFPEECFPFEVYKDLQHCVESILNENEFELIPGAAHAIRTLNE